jgi:hypothetical protein
MRKRILAAAALLAFTGLLDGGWAQEIPTIYPRTIKEGPIELTVVPLADEPTLDGRDLEWKEIQEAVVPLWPTVERDPDNHLGPVDLMLKAGSFKDRLYLLLRWPDPSPSTTHLSWVWDFTTNSYRQGQDREDRLAIRWGLDESFRACLLGGPPHRADLWLWQAARTNPVGYALDATQLVSLKPIADGKPWRTPGGKVRWLALRLDKGAAFTYSPKYSSYKGDIVPRFIVKKAEKLSGSRKDVEAKGLWVEGYWTLEMARNFKTDDPNDIAFERGSVVELAISAANRSEGAHESVSPLIRLRFPPKAKKTASE